MKAGTKQAKREKLWIDVLERKLDSQGLEIRNQALLNSQEIASNHELAVKILQESNDYEEALNAIENLETSDIRFKERLFECLSLGFTDLEVWEAYYLTINFLEKIRYRRDRIRPDDRMKNESTAIHYTRLSMPLDLPNQIKERHKKFEQDKREENERLNKLLSPLASQLNNMDKFSAKYDDVSDYDAKKVSLEHLGFYKALSEYHEPYVTSDYAYCVIPNELWA